MQTIIATWDTAVGRTVASNSARSIQRGRLIGPAEGRELRHDGDDALESARTPSSLATALHLTGNPETRTDRSSRRPERSHPNPPPLCAAGYFVMTLWIWKIIGSAASTPTFSRAGMSF
jgi:hypothetical protein